MLHSSHHENMKMPIPVLSVGLIGIFTNTIAYAIIGGISLFYSYLQTRKYFLFTQDTHVNRKAFLGLTGMVRISSSLHRQEGVHQTLS